MNRTGLALFYRSKCPLYLHQAANGRCSRIINRRFSHRTYFQPDSQAYRPVPLQQYEQPPQEQEPQRGPWTWILVGFLAFPIVWSATEGLAARGLLPARITHQLFPMFQMGKTLDNLTQELEIVKFSHSHESDMHQALQRLYREHLTAGASDEPQHERRVVRDDDIIARRPISLDDGQIIAAKDACLLRVVDGNGRNQVIILGVDLAAYTPSARQEPSDLHGLHRWVYQLVEDMHSEGATAFNTEGETMYMLYTNNAIAMGPFYAGSEAAGATSHTEIIVVDTLKLPPGWPIAQLRRVKECDATDERAKAKDAGVPDLTAEGVLASDVLPHGPFR